MKALPPLVLAVRHDALRCLGLLVVGATVAVATQWLAADAVDLQTRETERHAALLAEGNAASSDALQVEAGKARFGEMVARDLVGSEHRLDWIRRVAEIKDAQQLAELEFELAPQQSAVIEGMPQKAGRYEFLASTMKLRIALLHEQDLLDFLAELGNSVSALLRIRSCRIERSAETGIAAAIRLKADCSIDWVTLRERS